MIAVQLMSELIQPVTGEFTVEEVLEKMHLYQVKHLPVIEKNSQRFLGIISEEDLQTKPASQAMHELSTYFIMLGVAPEQHVQDIVYILSYNEVTVLPVFSLEKYIGCIRRQDPFRLFGRSVAFEPGGNIVEIWVKTRNYSLSEIARIAESENVRIASLIISESDPVNDRIKITIKMDNDQIDSVLASFERFGYEIAASYPENNDYMNLLKERYESLMHYLNV
jgi:acetoin utilization protein AcuB